MLLPGSPTDEVAVRWACTAMGRLDNDGQFHPSMNVRTPRSVAHMAMHQASPASSPASSASVSANYRERAESFGKVEDRLGRLAFQLTIALRGTAIAVAACIVGLIFDYRSPGLWGTLVGLLGAASVLLMLRDRKEHERRRYEQLRVVNEQSLARIDRRWDDIPAPAVRAPQDIAELSADLEIFGRASLFQLLCAAETTAGISELKAWLSAPAAPAVVSERQRAVAALAPELDRRQELQVCGRLLSRGLAPPADFLQWAESDRRVFGAGVIWLARISAAIVVLLAAALMLKLVSAEVGGTALCAMVIANILTTAIFGGRVFGAYRAVASGALEASLNHDLYQHAAGFPAEGAMLSQINAQAVAAMREMSRLVKLVVLADLRRSALFYLPLQFLFLWDLHVVDLLERWRARAGRSYREWFGALGELEALCSLAAIAHDNPGWTFPEIRGGAPRVIDAAGLGHPLLSEPARVVNDVTVGPPGEILMVTGSNMSGKSTLLRSLGANIVLAQAGAPVCASRMSLPPVELVTVMRVSDSLERGVSLFMAELNRLKYVVQRAGADAIQSERQLCYLLDEILHGTNTAERHLAAVRILRRLIDAGAIGAVSTHDLALCSDPALADRSRNVHFQETIHHDGERVRMTFDYQLRPGIAQTTNVRFLLDAVGLPALEGES